MCGLWEDASLSPDPSEVPDLDRIVPVLLEHGLERLPEHCRLSPGTGCPWAPRRVDPSLTLHTAGSGAMGAGAALLQVPFLCLFLASSLQGGCEGPS